MLTLCPICSAITKDHFQTTPYWICPNCDVYFQDPAPPKIWHGEHEPPPEAMSDGDKAANEGLAGWLFDEVMKGVPGPTLDIGASWPYLASRLKARGCDAHAMDGQVIPNDLGVPIIAADLEQDGIPFDTQFVLVTFIHSFEHLFSPAEALIRIRYNVADGGRVFIRSPDHRTPGYERDLTPGHLSIHPFFHTLSSILQCCAEAGDCFEVESYSQFQPGQMQVVLRPLMEAPSIAVGMIVKNEERDLPRALRSLHKLCPGLYIVDTGSTDGTLKVAEGATKVVTFTDASVKDEAGDWKLQDFSAARNQAIELAERDSPVWYLWLDADDVLITPDAIRRASYWAEKDCFALWVQAGTSRWITHRMWKTGKGVRFKGRVHEYPVLEGLNIGQLDDSLIIHHADPHPGENSNIRNLRILMLEWEEAPTPRTAFYIANTHRDGGRHKEAIKWYRKRIELGVGYRDEWLFSKLYQIRSARTCDPANALAWARQAVKEAPDWMEFRMELAQIQYTTKHYEDAIDTALPALDAPIPFTQLWREEWNYKDAPARLISWCHEHLGDIPEALKWAKLAKDRIGNPDPDWDARIERLERKGAPAIVGLTRDVICVRRPGAIGDVLMTLNLLPALKEANPGREIWYFTDPRLAADDALGWIIRAAGAHQVMSADTFEAWARNSEKAIDLVGYPLQEDYPNKPIRLHLLHYFAAELSVPYVISGTPYKGWRDQPALTVRLPKLNIERQPYITVQPKAGWSKYKQWPLERWAEVYKALPDIEFFVFDESIGKPLRDVIAIFANARMHIGIDSFANHLTNYIWQDEQGNGRRVPGVILWGSTQASAAGYPHNTNISLGLPCQPCFRESPSLSRMPRGPCVNPPRASYDDDTPWACTRDISVEQVVEAVRTMWEQQQ